MSRYFLVIFLFSSFCSFAQKDTEFWFAAPEVSIGTANFDKPIRFFITTYAQAATVTVSQPANGGMPDHIVSIPANTSQSVDVTNWISNIENSPANAILNYGIKIVSTAPVTVYYEVVSLQCLCNPEIFVLKGRNAVGNSFFIPAQTIANNNNSFSPQPYSAFDIVATENGTTVTIKPANAIVGHPAGTTFTVTLNQGQTYSATATGQSASQHLNGSTVVTDKPVAVTVKDDMITGPHGGCSDLAGDQIVPVNIIGTEYIAVSGALNAPYDQVYVMGTQNGTSISQNGVAVGTLNAGQSQQLTIGGSSTYIQSSLPVYVLQLSGIGCELSESVLPKLECTGSDKVSFARSSPYDLYINLVVKSGGQGNFLVNGLAGVVTAAQFAAVPGTGNQWYAAQVLLPVGQYPQNSVISVANTSHLFHLGVLDGSDISGARFGYFSNYSFDPVVTSGNPEICEGEDIYLFTEAMFGATYHWSGPNGFTSTVQNPVINGAAVAASGLYTLTVDVSGCLSSADINITVHPRPVVSVVTDKDSVCGSNIATLIASGADNYTWTPSAGLSNNTGSFVLAAPVSNTVYTVVGQDANQCIDSASVSLIYGGFIYETRDVEICEDSSFVFGNLLVNAQGVYIQAFVGVTGCDSLVTLNVSVKKPPPPVTFDVKDVCIGEELLVTASRSGAYTYNWNFDGAVVMSGIGKGPYSLMWNDTGVKTISLEMSNNCGVKLYSDSFLVHGRPMARINSVEAVGLCGGDSIMLTAYSEPGYHYKWLSMGRFFDTDGPVTGLMPLDGYVKLVVSTDFGCKSSDSVYVMVDPCCVVALPSAFTPNGDGKNDVYKIITLGNNQLLDLMIANRYGQMVFVTNNLSSGWDGTYKGRLADMGVYNYILRYKCFDGSIKFLTGDVTLLR